MQTTLDAPAAEAPRTLTERILISAKEPGLRKVLSRLFTSAGYEVDMVPDGRTALFALQDSAPSAFVIDIQSSGAGTDVCREILRLLPGLPLVVLSTNSDTTEKILFLELGADDYVNIPFSPRELLARTRALIRRSARMPASHDFCAFSHVRIDFNKMEVTKSGETVTLTAKEYKTLEFMTRNARRVISRDELLNQVWGYHHYPCTRTVDNHILRLRRKLEKDRARPVHFLTFHGVGYKFMP
jgi:DNA-binding response OmpR family regulator